MTGKIPSYLPRVNIAVGSGNNHSAARPFGSAVARHRFGIPRRQPFAGNDGKCVAWRESQKRRQAGTAARLSPDF